MEFTGERFLPELQGDIRLEHFQRYNWCLPWVEGKTVLDIASGEGYGSSILAGKAQQVTGVDISHEAVAHAQAKYRNQSNLSFLQGSAAKIPMADDSVDVIVSFETIEHHDQHEEMLAEVRRVLKPEGIFIISSPNKKIYSDLTGEHHNHYHVKELYFEEFDALLRSKFEQVHYYGQRVSAASMLLPLNQTKRDEPPELQVERASGIEAGIPSQIEAMYFLAIASSRKLENVPQASVLFSEIDNPFYDVQRQMVDLSREIRRMSAYIQDVEIALHTRETDVKDLVKVLDEKSVLQSRNESVILEIQQLLKIRDQELLDAKARLDWGPIKLMDKLRKKMGRQP